LPISHVVFAYDNKIPRHRRYVWYTHRVHRVATVAFWRTFHHEGKIAQAGEGGGARHPPFTIFTITSKVAVYAPAEWADTLTLFHL
jgi:hypothetical protein